MPFFEYKAVAPSGETVQGTMEAASLDLVVLKLQEAGNIPIHAKESGAGGLVAKWKGLTADHLEYVS